MRLYFLRCPSVFFFLFHGMLLYVNSSAMTMCHRYERSFSANLVCCSLTFSVTSGCIFFPMNTFTVLKRWRFIDRIHKLRIMHAIGTAFIEARVSPPPLFESHLSNCVREGVAFAYLYIKLSYISSISIVLLTCSCCPTIVLLQQNVKTSKACKR